MEFLPIELHYKICRFLDKKSLINMASTCKGWRDFILLTPELMLCFHFYLTNIETQLDFYVKFGRGMSYVTIGRDLPGYQNFNRSSTLNLGRGKLKQLLGSIPNVKELELKSVNIPKIGSTVPEITLNRLEKLKLVDNSNNYRVFFYLSSTRSILVYTCEIHITYDEINYFHDPGYWRWLNSQSNLKTINLVGFSAIAQFSKYFDVAEVKFNLEKLVLQGSVFHDGSCEFNLIGLVEFLKKQNLIREISIENFERVYDDVGRFSITNLIAQITKMPSVKVLNLKYSDDSFVLNVTEPNHNLEQLSVSNAKNIDKYFDQYPGIQCFKWAETNYTNIRQITEVLNMASTKLVELRKLKLHGFDLHSVFTSAKFSKMEKISLAMCRLDPNDWKLLVENLPMIKELVLDYFCLLNESVGHIKNWRYLKLIKFKCGYYERGMIHILSKCHFLKKIKISPTMKFHLQDELQYTDLSIEIMTGTIQDERIGNFNIITDSCINNKIDFGFSASHESDCSEDDESFADQW